MSRSENVLLFLDFDGVTHPAHESTLFFNADCMFWLEKLIKNNSALLIVISSSWREHYPIEELKTMLGPIVAQRVIGVTPVINKPFLKGIRYREVIAHLKKTNNINTDWFAVDDVKGFYMGHEDKVIFTNPRFGFSQKEYEEVNFLLNGKSLPKNASNTKKIINRILQLPKDKSFTNKTFLNNGSKYLVNKVLAQMHHVGLISRSKRGVYARR